MELVTDIHRATVDFPQEEICGLGGDLRRSAVAVPSNLAHGLRQNSVDRFQRFIGRARESLAAVETQLEVARSLGYVSGEKNADLLAQVSSVDRMLIELGSWPVGA